LIPKKIVGKNDISKTVPFNLGLFDTITYTMKDKSNQYIEHQGNVYYGTIAPQNIKISNIPSANNIITITEYSRETKEHLTSPETNLDILKRAELNKSRMTPRMVEKVETTKNKIKQKLTSKVQEQSKDTKELEPEFKSFKWNSITEKQKFELKIQKNQIQAMSNPRYQKQLTTEKAKVKTLTNYNNKGFTNVVTLSLITSFVSGALFMLMYLIIK
jgi:flagellar biosynthesis GTPase FlhF